MMETGDRIEVTLGARPAHDGKIIVNGQDISRTIRAVRISSDAAKALTSVEFDVFSADEELTVKGIFVSEEDWQNYLKWQHEATA